MKYLSLLVRLCIGDTFPTKHLWYFLDTEDKLLEVHIHEEDFQHFILSLCYHLLSRQIALLVAYRKFQVPVYVIDLLQNILSGITKLSTRP